MSYAKCCGDIITNGTITCYCLGDWLYTFGIVILASIIVALTVYFIGIRCKK